MFESWPELWGGSYPAYRTTLRKFLWFRTVTGGNAPQYETVIGRIVSFITRRIAPLKIEAALTPIQDLHGYDAPYPAGGGANRYDKDAVKTSAGNYILNDNGIQVSDSVSSYFTEKTPVLPNTTYYRIGNTVLGGLQRLYFFDGDGNFISRTASVGGANGTFTTPANCYYIGYQYVKADLDASKWAINYPATVTTFAPYSNECPITGHTGAEINRTGKNLAKLTYGNKVPSVSTGQMVTANGWSSDYIHVFNLEEYTMQRGTIVATYILFYDNDKSYLGYYQLASGLTNYLLSDYNKWSQTSFIKLRSDANSSTDPLVQLELGSTASAYEPFSGSSVTINFGQTVYGGTLTVNKDGTGSVVADVGKKVFNGSESGWGDYASYNGYVISIPDMKNGTRQDGVCNMLVDSKTSAQGQKNTMWLGVNSRLFFAIGVYETMGATLEDFKTYLSTHNLEVVYPLTTPVTIPLTPGIVEALQGNNTVWVDATDGDSPTIKVTYRSN